MCWCLIPCVCAHRFKPAGPRCFADPCTALHTNNPLGFVRTSSGGETIQWINVFDPGESVEWDSQTQRGWARCQGSSARDVWPTWASSSWLSEQEIIYSSRQEPRAPLGTAGGFTWTSRRGGFQASPGEHVNSGSLRNSTSPQTSCSFPFLIEKEIQHLFSF